MLYFAYGSNMDWQRMKERCPSVSFVGNASLPDYELAFTRECQAGHGVADIRPSKGKTVWGVVYKMDELDLGSLDCREGFKPQRRKNAYRLIEFQVLANGKPEKPMTVWSYEVVEKANRHIPPDEAYMGHILRGADDWQLPAEYVNLLKEIEVKK